jgi:hypothetical protein
MKTKLFMQDEQIEVTLDDWRSRSINSKCDEIRIEGKPIVKSDGSQTIMKLTLRIERLELCQVLHPEAPVDQRPTMGFCTCKPCPGDGKIYCEYRKTNGECTSNSEDTGVQCEYKCCETFCDGCPGEPGAIHVLKPDCNYCIIYKGEKPKAI